MRLFIIFAVVVSAHRMILNNGLFVDRYSFYEVVFKDSPREIEIGRAKQSGCFFLNTF